jgi:hypothetical protein
MAHSILLHVGNMIRRGEERVQGAISGDSSSSTVSWRVRIRGYEFLTQQQQPWAHPSNKPTSATYLVAPLLSSFLVHSILLVCCCKAAGSLMLIAILQA